MNPHEEVQENAVVSAKNLFGDSVLERYRNNKRKKATERGELYLSFMEKINPSRKALGFSLLTESRMGYITQGIPTHDLSTFYHEALKAKDFTAKFNGMFFPKTSYGTTT
jgi:hypothetical protein